MKVTRSAVANAASIAGLLLTTESLVVEKPEAARAGRPAAATATVTATSTARASDPVAPTHRIRAVRAAHDGARADRSCVRYGRCRFATGWPAIAAQDWDREHARRAVRRAGRASPRPRLALGVAELVAVLTGAAVGARWSRSAAWSSTPCPSRSSSSRSTLFGMHDKMALLIGTVVLLAAFAALRRRARAAPAGVGAGRHRRCSPWSAWPPRVTRPDAGLAAALPSLLGSAARPACCGC